MGMNNYSYLTPYLRVKVPTTKKEVFFSACSNQQCANHKKTMTAQFCSLCGSPQGKGSKTEIVPVADLFELIVEQQKEALYICSYRPKDGSQILLSNHHSPRETRIKDDEYAIELPDDVKATDLQWFTTHFAKEIAQIKLLLGEENVSLHWGLVSYSA